MEDVQEFFERESEKCQTLAQLETRYRELYYEARDWADNDEERLELLRTRLEETFAQRYAKLQSERNEAKA
jgi:hypothetical protein